MQVLRDSQRLSLVVALSLGMVVAGSLASEAQRRRAVSVGAPVATNTVAADPDAYYGKTVTMSAHVEQILSTTAFTIDQRKVAPGGKELASAGSTMLVIVPTLSGPVELNTYLTLVGEIVKFDPKELAKKAREYSLDLSPDVVAKFQGRPALLATSVINSQYVELAKPPTSAD